MLIVMNFVLNVGKLLSPKKGVVMTFKWLVDMMWDILKFVVIFLILVAIAGIFI